MEGGTLQGPIPAEGQSTQVYPLSRGIACFSKVPFFSTLYKMS